MCAVQHGVPEESRSKHTAMVGIEPMTPMTLSKGPSTFNFGGVCACWLLDNSKSGVKPLPINSPGGTAAKKETLNLTFA